jgi:hypothetical protein
VALGQVLSEYFGFHCQFSFHRLLHTHHLSFGAGTIGLLVADVQSGLSHPTQKKRHSALFGVLERQCTAGNSCDSQNTYTANTATCPARVEPVLLHGNTRCYPGRRHPHANAFSLELGFLEVSLTATAHVNAGRPRTVRAEDTIIAAVEREPWRSENWRSPKVLKIQTTTRGANISVLYRCNSANGYNIHTIRMSYFCVTLCRQTKNVLCVRVC